MPSIAIIKLEVHSEVIQIVWLLDVYFIILHHILSLLDPKQHQKRKHDKTYYYPTVCLQLRFVVFEQNLQFLRENV